jgi:hypothetical protein
MTSPTIERANERVAAERSSIGDELASFERFRETIREAPIQTTSRSDLPESASVDRVRRCYRTTVETLNDESLQASFEAEFPAALATTVLEADELTGRLKRRLLGAVDTAITNRQSFVAVLDSEERSLETAGEALLDVRRPLDSVPTCCLGDHAFDDVLEAWGTLDKLEHRCEAVAIDRQRYVHDIRDRIESPVSIHEYLYDGYPVLNATTVTLDRIETKRARTVGARPDPDSMGPDDSRDETAVGDEKQVDEPSVPGGV